MSDTNTSTGITGGDNVRWLAQYREDGVKSAAVLRYVSMGRHAKNVDVRVFGGEYERIIVSLAAVHKGRWVALGGKTLIASIVDYTGCRRDEVSRALARLRKSGLVVVDATPAGAPRLNVITPKMNALVEEVEFRVAMSKSVSEDDLKKIVGRLGWEETSSRLRSILDDPDRGLDFSKRRDREIAWEVLVDMGPKGRSNRW